MLILDLIIIFIFKFSWDYNRGYSLSVRFKVALNFIGKFALLKFILYILLMFEVLPTVYKGNKWSAYMLSQEQESSLFFLKRNLSIFYPLWGSHFYRISEENAKNRPDILNENYIRPLRGSCKDSQWTNKQSCLEYVSRLSKMSTHQDEFLNNVTSLYANYPETVCSTGESFLFLIGIAEAERIERIYPEKKGYLSFRHKTGLGLIRIYDEYFKDYLEKSASEGCVSNAIAVFKQIKRSEEDYGSWNPKKESINYFKFICSKYEIACNYVWHLYFKVYYKDNNQVVNALHKEVCTKYNYRFCNYKRDMTSKEYNEIQKDLRSKGIRTSPFD